MALSKLDYTLIHLIEEASEIQKAASKALRFGIDHIDPKNNKPNIQNISDELHDLDSIKIILQTEFRLPYPTDEFAKSQHEKGDKMFEYAKSLGRVID